MEKSGNPFDPVLTAKLMFAEPELERILATMTRAALREVYHDDAEKIVRDIVTLTKGMDTIGRLIYSIEQREQQFRERLGEKALDTFDADLRDLLAQLGDSHKMLVDYHNDLSQPLVPSL